MTFQPGQSGNPGGRKRVDHEVVALARAAGPKAIKRLVEMIDDPDARIASTAANSILDRAYGKPTQRIAGDEEADAIRQAITVTFK